MTTTTLSLEALREQLDHAEQTHIAMGIKVQACTDKLTDAIDEHVKTRRIWLALSKEVAAREREAR